MLLEQVLTAAISALGAAPHQSSWLHYAAIVLPLGCFCGCHDVASAASSNTCEMAPPGHQLGVAAGEIRCDVGAKTPGDATERSEGAGSQRSSLTAFARSSQALLLEGLDGHLASAHNNEGNSLRSYSLHVGRERPPAPFASLIGLGGCPSQHYGPHCSNNRC